MSDKTIPPTSSGDAEPKPLLHLVQNDNPLLDYLGIRVTEWMPGFAKFQLMVESRHLNRQGSVQGGVVATLLDAACGYAGLQGGNDAPPEHSATVMLTISYIAKARQGQLTAIGRMTGSGRSLYFSAAELVDDHGTLIATAQGSFKRATPRSGG